MPASEASIRITDRYRARLIAIHGRAGVLTRQAWAVVDPEDLDGSYPVFARNTTAALEVLQATGVALTSAYLAAFTASELGRRPGVPPLLDESAVGMAQHGAPMVEAIMSPLIGIKDAIVRGKPRDAAVTNGLSRAARLVQSAALHAPRAAMAAEIRSSPTLVGWRRVTSGGCGACLAAASNSVESPRRPLRVHSHCRCTAEPVVHGAKDTVTRPTGFEMFSGLPRQRQDQLLGPDKAELVRSGRVPFERLISTDPMAVGPDQLTEAPLQALT